MISIPNAPLAAYVADLDRLVASKNAVSRRLGSALLTQLATDPAFAALLREMEKGQHEKMEQALDRVREKAKVWGPKKWEEFHRAMLAGFPSAEALDAWLKAFIASIPCAICQNHFQRAIAKLPPRHADPFAWGVEIHNIVTTEQKTGAAIMTVAEARVRWA